MNKNQKKVVVVAVKAANEIPKTAMEWALAHVVQPGNCIKLLVVTSPQSFGKRLWGLQRFTTDCTSRAWRSHTGTLLDQEEDISESCLQLMHQLCKDQKSGKISMKIKVLSGSVDGVVAAEVNRDQTNWVILDKLKNEAKRCMEQLHCNVIFMKGSHPKVLRLNLTGSDDVEPEMINSLSLISEAPHQNDSYDFLDTIRVPNVTPISTPEHDTSYTATDVGTSSISSSDAGTSSYFPSGTIEDQKKELLLVASESDVLEDSDTDNESMSSTSCYQPWMLSSPIIGSFNSRSGIDGSLRSTDQILACASINLLKKFSVAEMLNPRQKLNSNSISVREAISLSKKSPADPPPLCSKCQHQTPVFGKPPQSFTYAELATATNGFSINNFLAEGGYGSVYRGVLQDGQIIAVKQYKLASSQGDLEFCAEVEVLSCAQHRNVVTLIGFCVEGGRRLLVYEYICNNSLDYHLYGRSCNTLEWPARQKIAVGAARGLRYLHEECRVGCIVHRDMRPNNILLTHDFEPLVGDFGLARCQPDGGVGEQTRVIGTFGYLAPEYAQSGQITEKADVYSFGIVLLELITGRKAVDINRPRGEQCLTEWARRVVKEVNIKKLIDPCLGDSYVKEDLCSMLQCASLCIRKDPDSRPRMSQVLRMLESGMLSPTS
ncbi:inactive protein kinase SELMODRAFT_444075 isoform X2 [Beta vulgaris subsp. vulgaris]|uniref:inactive protein kinase SELMODRAFT_444075 isoform X2 n=1 Tax=Beta vulgaris subsp. vulgaris TaxID=3555 RepID=UPI00053F8423|nr:inactive protein kinase SELMODRAFT_444075 isoform X2 [Beta vulgaris subsp. vulgaris]